MLRHKIAAIACGVILATGIAGSRAEPPEKPHICTDVEDKLSYRGFKHCEYHPMYQKAFAKWHCQCLSGQCRPTTFRVAPVTVANTVGLEVMINGRWFPIPPASMRKEKADMPSELLQWDGHVCASDPTIVMDDEKKVIISITPPTIECTWINTPS